MLKNYNFSIDVKKLQLINMQNELQSVVEIPDWLRPRRGIPRMFENEILERLSHVHPITPHIIYVPVISYMLWKSFKLFEFSKIILLFFFGIFIWTIMEYTLHRFVFHFTPKSEIGKKIHFIIHGVHHMYPWDTTRLVMPPAVSILIAIVVFSIMSFIFGDKTYPIYAGTALGYLIYDTTHFSVHYFKAPKNRILRYLWKHHLQHHFQNPYKKFGVSSPLWDIVFRTK
jgi:hypothetical protein